VRYVSRDGLASSRGVARPVAASLLWTFAAGCAPQVIWSGRDPQRQLTAEVVASGDQQWLRTAGHEGSHFDVVAPAGIVFSPKRSKLAYAAMHNGQWWMILSEKKLGPWKGVAEPCFSRDGTRFAFAAQTETGWHAVVDGKLGEPFEAIQARTLQFSEDGAHVAYVGSTGSCAFIVVDGEVGPCRERVRSLRVTNPGRVAAVVRVGSQEFFLFGSNKGAPTEGIGDWTVTDDGHHFAYAARTRERWIAIVDGKPSADCERVQHLRFGNAGRRSAWVCSEGSGASVVVDGIAGSHFAVVSAPQLASRAPDYAYVAQDERGAWVVSEGSMRGPFAQVSQLLLADRGGVVAFIARVAGTTWLVHGTREIRLSAVVDGSLVLSDDGKHWAVIDGDSVERALWLVIDGKRARRVAPEEVFGESAGQLTPWLERELREASSAEATATDGS